MKNGHDRWIAAEKQAWGAFFDRYFPGIDHQEWWDVEDCACIVVLLPNDPNWDAEFEVSRQGTVDNLRAVQAELFPTHEEA